jgi:hypothetical protein
MPNHLHIIWRVQNDYRLEDAQRDFLKFTAKELLELIKMNLVFLHIILRFRIVGRETNNNEGDPLPIQQSKCIKLFDHGKDDLSRVESELIDFSKF